MSLNPQLLPIKKDSETIRKTVLRNILEMVNARKLIKESSIEKNMNKFEKMSDNNIYIIDTDEDIMPDKNDDEYIKKFKKNNIVIKIIPQKVTGIHKSPIIKEFTDSHSNYHKILIFENITDKAKSTIMSSPNTEVFNEVFFMINFKEHIDSPSYEILNKEEINELLETYNCKKSNLMKMLSSDPASLYYNLKREDVVRIIRNSEQAIEGIAYRIVV